MSKLQAMSLLLRRKLQGPLTGDSLSPELDTSPATSLQTRGPRRGWVTHNRFSHRSQPRHLLSSHSTSCILVQHKHSMLSITTGPLHRLFSPAGLPSPHFSPSNKLLPAQSLHPANSSTPPRTDSSYDHAHVTDEAERELTPHAPALQPLPTCGS